jgi:HEAT repeat protein
MKGLLAGALALVALAALTTVGRRPQTAPPAGPPPAVEVPSAVAPAPPSVLPAENDVRLLAIRTVDLLAARRADPAAEAQAQDAAALLRGRLLLEPRLWAEVVDVLSSVDDPPSVLRLVTWIEPSMDDAAEVRFIELLGGSPSMHVRDVSVEALAGRTSPQSLAALIEAVQSDPSPSVRLRGLKALARRKDRAGSTAAESTIQAVFVRRAQVEPDLEIRKAAMRAAGQVVPEDVAGPRPEAAPDRTRMRVEKPAPPPPAAPR